MLQCNGSQEVQDSDYPLIRIMTVGELTYSSVPLDDLAAVQQPWVEASLTSMAGDDESPTARNVFSATSWFFGKRVFIEALKKKVPVGLVSSNWSGTYVAAWTSAKAVAQCPAPGNGTAPNQPPFVYNAMVHPFRHMNIKGLVWYQAEQDLLHFPMGGPTQGDDCAVYCDCEFPVVIRDWQETFGISDLPFFFVQLAAFIQDGSLRRLLGLIRVTQVSALALPRTCMASAVDLGDVSSTEGNIPLGTSRRLDIVSRYA